MSTTIETSAATSLSEVNLRPRGPVQPSPLDWRDQFFYFLLPDRFSDGAENTRPLFDAGQPEQFRTTDKAVWMEAGKRFQGGTIQGITSKLDYLQQLGVNALWIGPLWRQRPDLQTYHGYGIQNFLEIDPRYGSRQDLRNLVDAAHAREMYVVLDIIYNHTGNNWFYDLNGFPHETLPYRYQGRYDIHGWRAADGRPVPHIAMLDEGVWPREFQNPEWYTRAGQIGRWDPAPWEDPLHPENEFRRGDFYDLKDLDLNQGYVLSALIRVYQYWIALTDCDGFRIDTVKHITRTASRNFCGAIREFAESIGKNNFLLLGEVTGGEGLSRNYLEIFGRNLDAVLDIGAPTSRLAGMVKGFTNPSDFFGQFGVHDHLGSHRETGRYHVSVLDDHDMVGRAKHRFAAHMDFPASNQQVAHAIGVQLTTLGIPCLYYGTEQAFDGTQDRHDFQLEPHLAFEDRYIREAMFGAEFGAFETSGCHFFDLDHPTYKRIAAIARLRNQDDLTGLALRRGRQYLRETSFLGLPFALHGRGELAAWSRILFDREVLIALNTHATEGRGAEINIDSSLHHPNGTLTYLYRSDWPAAQLEDPPHDQTSPIQSTDGRMTVRIDLPPAGMAILA